jgi:Holliday junction DNA helicase RuvA
MIAHISGQPVATGDRWVVLDVGGIGYQVQVTQPALQILARTQDQIKLFTYMAVREDAVTLYGFLKPSELEMFRILIGVTGIGPQIALNILSQVTIEEFAVAILNEDERALTRISGIGPKSAKRLILELRDKMKKVGDAMAAGGTRAAGGSAVRDAVSALVSLGFAERAAVDAVNAAATSGPADAPVQTLIKAALAKMRDL